MHHKVNRRQAREDALGYSVSRKLMPAKRAYLSKLKSQGNNP